MSMPIALFPESALKADRSRVRPVFAGCFGLLLALSAPLAGAATAPATAPAGDAGPATTCPVQPSANALWDMVACCEKSLTADPHCRVVNTQYKYIVAKDNSAAKPEAYLSIPTVKMIGIEAPETLQSPTLDIWQDGWQEAVKKYPGVAEAKTGLAINSAHSRDQNQLHIHMSCVRPDVLSALTKASVGTDVKKPLHLNLPPHNNPYVAVKLKSLAGDSSPFKVLRTLPHVTAGNVQDQSIAILKAPEAGTYYLVNTYYHDQDKGEAEELLDQKCGK